MDAAMIPARFSAAEKARREAILGPWEARLRDLRRQAKGAHATVMDINADRIQTIAERNELARYIEAHGRREPSEVDEYPSVTAARYDIDLLTRRLAELDEALEEARLVWAPQCRLIASCEEWLQDNADSLIRAANG